MKTLYLCYYGVREPLVQTQVLPYLRQLVGAGIEVSLLTFEPELKKLWSMSELATQTSRLHEDGITWNYRPYHKKPSMPATAYDVFVGSWVAARLVRRGGIDVLHARSHVPLAMALIVKVVTGCRLIFDIRGLWAEEYVDIGNWTEHSVPFRAIKTLERIGLRKADQVVVLTQRMRDWLAKEQLAPAEKVTVIPCCTDLSRFKSSAPSAPESNRFEMVYAGTATGLHLLEEVARLFLKLRVRKPDAFLRILTYSSAAGVSAVLRSLGLESEDFWVGLVPPDEIPNHLLRSKIGVSFRKATFAQIAASPAKIPEYLAAGLPIISNSGIGDLDELLKEERVGVVIEEFSDNVYEEAVDRILELLQEEGIQARCQNVARKYFDLVQIGGPRYLSVYNRIAGANS